MRPDQIIYKENLSIKKRGQWNSIKGYCGCYIFTLNNKPQYIGMSKNLYLRMINHFSNGGICNEIEFDAIYFIFTNDYKNTEKKLIEYFNPVHNGNLTSGIYKRY